MSQSIQNQTEMAKSTVVVSLDVHPNLANVTSRKEHFLRWSDATEKARNEFEHWLFHEDADAAVTPPRENRQSTPVVTVHASPRVIQMLYDLKRRPEIVAEVEEPAEFRSIGVSDR